MSPPVPLGYAESGDGAEPEKDRTQKKVTRTPEEPCAEERQDAEQNKVARLASILRPEWKHRRILPTRAWELLLVLREFPRWLSVSQETASGLRQSTKPIRIFWTMACIFWTTICVICAWDYTRSRTVHQ
jgi:hypothetical protein